MAEGLETNLGERSSHTLGGRVLFLSIVITILCLNLVLPVVSNYTGPVTWLECACFLGLAYIYCQRSRVVEFSDIAAPVFFLCALTLSLLVSADVVRSAIELLRLICFSSLLFVAVKCTSQEQERMLAACFCASYIVVILNAIMIVAGINFSGGDLESGGSGLRERAIGMAVSPGQLGYSAAIAMAGGMLNFGKILKTRGIRRLIPVGIMIASLYVLIKSDSRTGVVAIVVVAAALVFGRVARRVLRHSSVNLLAKASASIVIFGALLVPVWLGLVATPDMILIPHYRPETASSIDRILIWHTEVVYFIGHPLLGRGFGVAFLSYSGVGYLLYAHSLLVNYLGASGLIGTAAIVFLVVVTLNKIVDAFWIASLTDGINRVIVWRSPNMMRCVALLLTTITFSAIEGALQGMYASFIVFFIAFGILVTSIRAGRKTADSKNGAFTKAPDQRGDL